MTTPDRSSSAHRCLVRRSRRSRRSRRAVGWRAGASTGAAWLSAVPLPPGDKCFMLRAAVPHRAMDQPASGTIQRPIQSSPRSCPCRSLARSVPLPTRPTHGDDTARILAAQAEYGWPVTSGCGVPGVRQDSAGPIRTVTSTTRELAGRPTVLGTDQHGGRGAEQGRSPRRIRSPPAVSLRSSLPWLAMP